jgi:hypothetical protein
MPKRKDENEIAFSTLQELLRRDAERDGNLKNPPKPEQVPSIVRAGRIGKQIAKKAGQTRWQNHK